MNDREKRLHDEAVALGLFILAGNVSERRNQMAMYRIEVICREIGGSAGELISNCEQILAGIRANPLTEGE